MPELGSAYESAVDRATSVAAAMEVVRREVSAARAELSSGRMEMAYEAAYLRIFAEWESLLEEATLRYMCGYYSPFYTPSFPGNKRQAPSLAVAGQRLFGGQQFLLWHDPMRNVRRVQAWLVQSPIETVCVTAQQWLTWAGFVRHRIAHRSNDAR